MSDDPLSDSIDRVVTNWFKEIDQDSDSDETIVCYVSSMLEDPESLELDALEELVSGISPALACMPSAERLCKLLDLVQQVGAALPCAMIASAFACTCFVSGIFHKTSTSIQAAHACSEFPWNDTVEVCRVTFAHHRGFEIKHGSATCSLEGSCHVPQAVGSKVFIMVRDVSPGSLGDENFKASTSSSTTISLQVQDCWTNNQN